MKAHTSVRVTISPFLLSSRWFLIPYLSLGFCLAPNTLSQSVAVGHPFDTIKTKMQAQEGFIKGPGMVSSFSTVLKTQGLPGLYKVRMG